MSCTIQSKVYQDNILELFQEHGPFGVGRVSVHFDDAAEFFINVIGYLPLHEQEKINDFLELRIKTSKL